MREDEVMLDVKGLQKRMNIGRDSAYALMRSKGFPSIQIGKQYRVSPSAVDEWLKKYEYKTFSLNN